GPYALPAPVSGQSARIGMGSLDCARTRAGAPVMMVAAAAPVLSRSRRVIWLIALSSLTARSVQRLDLSAGSPQSLPPMPGGTRRHRGWPEVSRPGERDQVHASHLVSGRQGREHRSLERVDDKPRAFQPHQVLEPTHGVLESRPEGGAHDNPEEAEVGKGTGVEATLALHPATGGLMLGMRPPAAGDQEADV